MGFEPPVPALLQSQLCLASAQSGSRPQTSSRFARTTLSFCHLQATKIKRHLSKEPQGCLGELPGQGAACLPEAGLALIAVPFLDSSSLRIPASASAPFRHSKVRQGLTMSRFRLSTRMRSPCHLQHTICTPLLADCYFFSSYNRFLVLVSSPYRYDLLRYPFIKFSLTA